MCFFFVNSSLFFFNVEMPLLTVEIWSVFFLKRRPQPTSKEPGLEMWSLMLPPHFPMHEKFLSFVASSDDVKVVSKVWRVLVAALCSHIDCVEAFACSDP